MCGVFAQAGEVAASAAQAAARRRPNSYFLNAIQNHRLGMVSQTLLIRCVCVCVFF